MQVFGDRQHIRVINMAGERREARWSDLINIIYPPVASQRNITAIFTLEQLC